ncbi:MAG: HRDC domain-containing protein, partial [Coriobacteriaceae bacterium]|nr:HRDC domain-containing protein [Coriobacteriaceae bacterium]
IEFAEGVSPAEQRFLRERRERLLGEMIGYAMSTSCLRARVLRYFGQRMVIPAEGCGGCSVCTGETAERYLKVERKRRERDGGRVFGARAELDEPSRHERENLPEVVGDAWVHDGSDEELFQRLRVLRKSLASETRLAPYMIFSDRTLRAMVRRRPRTAEELLEIPGVGQIKLDRYGEAFLEELRN